MKGDIKTRLARHGCTIIGGTIHAICCGHQSIPEQIEAAKAMGRFVDFVLPDKDWMSPTEAAVAVATVLKAALANLKKHFPDAVK